MEALVNSPLVFLVAFAVAILVLKELFGGKKPYRRKGRYNKKSSWKKQDDRNALAADQLQKVMAADFKPRSLLNKSEANVFRALDEAVIARNSGWQVMAQVSLGEFLSSPDKSAFFSVNSKRVDFALMDEKCFVQHALEYQGKGHHQGSAAARDAVKKEALRKAGIGYHEIVAGHTTPSELRALVEKLVPAG
ncbi:DUF2726 domain-containing protein [Qipengyuania xiapuensis]|uniref:DUF2726 domain-containing protein n=1 Tax=Qipengyuania xiapuensis TaxID=2867236 RepID=A0ABX8ZSB2_9SPHN|nr:DUF2726 domain-containing protein [Qipengyuania xiapuensis]